MTRRRPPSVLPKALRRGGKRPLKLLGFIGQGIGARKPGKPRRWR